MSPLKLIEAIPKVTFGRIGLVLVLIRTSPTFRGRPRGLSQDGHQGDEPNLLMQQHVDPLSAGRTALAMIQEPDHLFLFFVIH